MADDQANVGLDTEITYEDFLRFTQSKGIKSTCPSCEVGPFLVISEVNGKKIPFMLARTHQESISESVTLDTVLNICENCGYIRQYSRAYILSWMRDAGSKE